MGKKERTVLFSFLLFVTVCMAFGVVHSQRFTAEQIASNEDEIIALVNEARAAAGAAPLVKNEALLPAANHRAEEASQKFSHTRPDGTQWKTVFDEFGIESPYRGENLAYGQKTPTQVMKAWMNSKGHRKNIVNDRFTEMAVGYYEKDGVCYWSQLFIEGDGETVAVEVEAVPAAPLDLPIATVNGVNLNLRSEADSDSKALTVMPDGTEVYVIGERGSWTQVRMADGTEGWAATKYLKFE